MDRRLIATALLLAGVAGASCGEIEQQTAPSAESRLTRPAAPARTVSPGATRNAGGDPETLLGFRPSGGAIIPEPLTPEEDDPGAIDLALDEVLYEPDPATRRMLLEWAGPAVTADPRLAHRRDEFAQVESELAAARPAQEGDGASVFLFDDLTADSPGH